jgi:AAA15 family ATPase/GTPase
MITAFTIKNFKAIGNDPVRIVTGVDRNGKTNYQEAENFAKNIGSYWVLRA